jgi:hypothetical protein
MAQTGDNHKTYILDFSYEDDDSSAVTVLINDVRFHITVDPKELQKSREKPLYYEYLDKISAVREAEEREEDRAEERQARVRSNESNGKERDDSEGRDSGIDITADPSSEYEEDEVGEDEDQDSESASIELRNWILAAFTDVTNTYAPPNREPEESTLYEWYHGPTYFYQMKIINGELSPELLETTSDLERKVENLVPKMKMPKYIQNYSIPWFNAHDLTVHSEVSMPSPAHPGKLTHKSTGEVYFFKPVVPTQPDCVKREIQILRKLQKLDLDIKAPHLLGFVSGGNSKTEAMGFLLSNIDAPTPLTQLLRSSIPESKRLAWSKKSEEYITLLHENNIIWGDAKADNFIVDAEDNLWIIDFGGSYTEGWIDPELSETLEGDEMGLGKVQAALEDPEKNTVELGLGDEEEESARETASGLFVTEVKGGSKTGKRKRAEKEVGLGEGGGKRGRGDGGEKADVDG